MIWKKEKNYEKSWKEERNDIIVFNNLKIAKKNEIKRPHIFLGKKTIK